MVSLNVIMTLRKRYKCKICPQKMVYTIFSKVYTNYKQIDFQLFEKEALFDLYWSW